MSDYNPPSTFDELYNELYNSYMEGNTSMSSVDNIINDVVEATSSSNVRKTRKKREYTERYREEGHERIWNDYFANNPVYNEHQFRRRFQMRKELFIRIVKDLENKYPYFQHKIDAIGRNSLSPLQKCTAAIRMLAYEVAGDALNDYVRIAGNTALQCLKNFCRGVIEIYEAQYLRRPTVDDVRRLLRVNEARGFPGMLGSIDCMHWQWEKCPVAWQGMYTRGSNNDINVLDRSPIFDELLEGRGPDIQYIINGTMYNLGYYLAYGIYPEWPVFVKSIPRANVLSEKRKRFAQYQEGARKDIERAFGVLQKRFAIVCNPTRLWKKTEVGDVMKACIILHNMIIEDERDDNDEMNPPRDVQYSVAVNQTEAPKLHHGLL